MRQGAQGWCTGVTQRDGMGREVGLNNVMLGEISDTEKDILYDITYM